MECDQDNQDKWDVSKILGEQDQAEIAKLARVKSWPRRWRCRLGIHHWSSWSHIGMFQCKAMNPATGEHGEFTFEIRLRCCFRCGRPDPHIRMVSHS